VIAKMDKTYERAEKVSIDDLWDVFSKLWSFNRNFNSIHTLYVPVIGTGFGRSGASIITAIKMMVLSFYAKSKEEKIANKLVIVVKANNKRYIMSELELFIKSLA
jgi:hypothetical protein